MKPSIQQSGGEVLRLDTSPGWRNHIIVYVKDGVLPNDRAEAQKLQHLATRYILLGDVLYKSYSKFHSDPYLRCLRPDETKEVMQEIHDGDYENHARGRSLTHKAINHGYYWPKMFKDTKEYVKRYPQCQIFAPSSSRPSIDLHTLRSSWPFMQWGLDVLDPLS